MEARVLSVVVAPEGEAIFSESATVVRIDDEGGGEYVVVSQESVPGRGNIAINPEEWPTLREAIDRMVNECRE